MVMKKEETYKNTVAENPIQGPEYEGSNRVQILYF